MPTLRHKQPQGVRANRCEWGVRACGCAWGEQVDYGRDFERQLALFVQARAAFPNLDGILQAVVQATCSLIMRTHRIVEGNHSRKTGAFVRVRPHGRGAAPSTSHMADVLVVCLCVRGEALRRRWRFALSPFRPSCRRGAACRCTCWRWRWRW
jgi:hypothetical protein